MAHIRIETTGTCDGGENPISARAREVAKRVQQLPDEVVASFTVSDGRKRALRLGQIGAEIQVGVVPLINWLERHRSPKDAALVFARLRLATDEAVACARSEIPEYTGGKNTPPVGQSSTGAQRTATLSVVTRLVAASLSDWADQINAEAGRTNPPVTTTFFEEEAGKRKRKPRVARDEANVRARAALKGRPPKGEKLWSQRTLAKAIGCADGQVGNLPAWQAYAEHHSLKRDKQQRAPKAVNLSDQVLASKGQEDTELDRLIAEQQANFEESPLVSNARKHRRRPKV